MTKCTRILAIILTVPLMGAGCDLVSAYTQGDVPTEAQLERMSAEEKEAGMQAMLEREPAPEFDDGALREARMEAIETMRDGTAERFADFNATRFHQVSGSARIVREGDRLTVVFSEEFSVTPGPRLVVRVSGREIAPLASTKGAQTYEIPDGIDLSSIDEIDVYSKPFHVVFARAPFGN